MRQSVNYVNIKKIRFQLRFAGRDLKSRPAALAKRMPLARHQGRILRKYSRSFRGPILNFNEPSLIWPQRIRVDSVITAHQRKLRSFNAHPLGPKTHRHHHF